MMITLTVREPQQTFCNFSTADEVGFLLIFTRSANRCEFLLAHNKITDNLLVYIEEKNAAAPEDI